MLAKILESPAREPLFCLRAFWISSFLCKLGGIPVALTSWSFSASVSSPGIIKLFNYKDRPNKAQYKLIPIHAQQKPSTQSPLTPQTHLRWYSATPITPTFLEHPRQRYKFLHIITNLAKSSTNSSVHQNRT